MPPMNRMNRPYEKADISKAMKKIVAYMNKYIVLILIALVLAAGGAVLTLLGPDMIGDITDVIKNGLYTGIDLDAVFQQGMRLAVIYVISALLTFFEQFIMATVTLKTSKRMRQELSEKLNRVPLSYFNSHSSGDLLSRITNDVMTLQQGLANALPSMVSSTAQLIGCIIMMFITEFRLAFTVILVTVIGMALMMLIMSRSQKYFVAKQKDLGDLNGYIEEMYTGHDVMRISEAEKKTKDKFDVLNQRVYVSSWKSQFLSGLMQPLMSVIGNIAYVAVCVFGAMLALDNVITFGVIISFILYIRLFTSPLTSIAQGFTNLQTAAASANRIFGFLESDELPQEEYKPALTTQIKGDVSFEHISFSYPDTPDKIIIKDFSADVKAGQKVAIVGPTGAGKTTMVNLLMRFYEINSGKITIDGIDTKDMRRDDIHNIFSMVLQDTWMFEGTVRENLQYNLKDISDEQMWTVLKATGLSHFVKTLPNGLDTMLSENTAISAGQKQLFTIARAMIQNSPMLILDEATSSVDTRTEEVIQKAMDSLTVGRTSFVIAHRLSTIRDADLILVMKDGDIIEKGTHDELISQNGFYADLYNSQFEKLSETPSEAKTA